jgi:hypothetical protein
MPIRTITGRRRPQGADELTRALVRELRHETRQGPEIIIEQARRGQPIHLYVVWDAWNDLSLQERSEIIMDAFEKAKGRQQSLLVTLAMGLTRNEAQRTLPSLVREQTVLN